MADLGGEKPYFLNFTGQIDSSSVSRICMALNAAVNDGADCIHMAMSSIGGMIADGVFLYNHIRAMPAKVIAYNTGTIASIAVAAFVGAEERYCSKHGIFMIHPTAFPQLPDMTAEKLRAFYGSALADDERTEAILRERTRLTDEFLNARRFSDVWFNPDVAVQHGVAHEVREFAVPKGYQVFQI